MTSPASGASAGTSGQVQETPLPSIDGAIYRDDYDAATLLGRVTS